MTTLNPIMEDDPMAKAIPPVIGIDVGGTNITAGLVDSRDKITTREKIDTEADKGAAHVLDRIALSVEQLISKAGVSRSEIGGICLGVPGALDVKKGIVFEAPNVRWNNVAVADAISKKVSLPVTLENDVNICTWGEYRLGAAKNSKALFGIFVGTGIGGGLVLNGELLHGVLGTAGEIGHITMDAHGPIGLRTLENLASRTAIVNRLVQLISANHESELPVLAGKRWPRIRSKVLARAYEGKDPLTVSVVNEAARTIGQAIASMVSVLSVDCVVVGGGVTEALNDRWMAEITKAFEEAVFPKVCRKCKVVASSLGDDAGPLGAALLARERLC